MKTLDETIDKLSGFNNTHETMNSALHYLKEYREHMTLEEYKDLCHKHNQAKLSWIQLQKMFQKPVYFVLRDDKSLKGWIILHELHITNCGCFVISTDDGCYPLADYEFYSREYA